MSDCTIPFEKRPTIRPTLVWMLVVVVLGGAAMWGVDTRPYIVGGRGPATLVVRALAFLTVIGVIRFLIRAYVLRRTTYRVGPEQVSKQYELLFRVQERTVPFSMVRSHEMNRGRVETLLGYGSITLNQGLGAMELRNVPDPDLIYEQVAAQVEAR